MLLPLPLALWTKAKSAAAVAAAAVIAAHVFEMEKAAPSMHFTICTHVNDTIWAL